MTLPRRPLAPAPALGASSAAPGHPTELDAVQAIRRAVAADLLAGRTLTDDQTDALAAAMKHERDRG